MPIPFHTWLDGKIFLSVGALSVEAMILHMVHSFNSLSCFKGARQCMETFLLSSLREQGELETCSAKSDRLSETSWKPQSPYLD